MLFFWVSKYFFLNDQLSHSFFDIYNDSTIPPVSEIFILLNQRHSRLRSVYFSVNFMHELQGLFTFKIDMDVTMIIVYNHVFLCIVCQSLKKNIPKLWSSLRMTWKLLLVPDTQYYSVHILMVLEVPEMLRNLHYVVKSLQFMSL